MISPVLFLIFKREDTTRRVFQRLREARPPKLYIAADGPRPNNPDEAAKCEATRKVVDDIDWPCEVHRLYRKENMGCGRGVSSAISWFFEQEPQGIIIEDDILPHPDFFAYCDEMLERYKNDERVQLITGRNAFYDGYDASCSYYLSSLFHIWGWASWRRVWKTYEFDCSKLQEKDFLKKLSERPLPLKTVSYWSDVFHMMSTNPIDTWDYQLYFNEIINGRYSIIPYVNQTENIGFDSLDATHTTGENIADSNHKAYSPYPIRHPDKLCQDEKADFVFANNFGFIKRSLMDRVILKLKKILNVCRI